MSNLIHQEPNNASTWLIPILLFISFLTYQWLSRTTSHKNLPPSPPKLPIIGNFHQLGHHPHRSLHSLSQQYGDLMLIHLGSMPCLIVSSATVAREIMKTHDIIFADRPKMPVFNKLLYSAKDIASAPYGEYWRQMRSIFVVHLLNNSRVKSYHRVRAEEVLLMVEKIKGSVGTEINLTDMVMSLTNKVVYRVAFGREYDGRGNRVLTEFAELLGGFYLGEFIPWMSWIHSVDGVNGRVERVANELDELLECIIQEHVDQIRSDDDDTEKSKDLVDVLLEFQRDHQRSGSAIDTESIKAIILDAFAAGTDTTYTVLEWGMSELIRHPTIMKKLQHQVQAITKQKNTITEDDLDKMPYLKAVIKETLRLHPPIPLLVPRASTQPMKLNGYDIPNHTRVITNAWAIQRDPLYWTEPNEFKPERFLADGFDSWSGSEVDFRGHDFQLIPFGAGRRGCPAISFAVITIELALANLVCWFDWSLPDGGGECEGLDMSEVTGLTIHRKTPLIVVPTLSGF